MTLVCASHPSVEAIARCVTCGLHLCAGCRTLDGVRNFCQRCHAELRSVAAAVPAAPRSPWLAAFLSLMPGLGQAYAGRWLRGALFFASAVLLRHAPWMTPLLGAFLFVFSLFDAYRLAQNRSDGHARGKAPIRADDTLFLIVGLGCIAATVFERGGFLALPGRALAPLALLATSLLVAHETRR